MLLCGSYYQDSYLINLVQILVFLIFWSSILLCISWSAYIISLYYLICSQSEDVELIENELALAKEQIELAKSFQQECKQLRQQPPSTIHNRSTRASNLITYILIVDLVDYDKPSEKKKKKNKVKTR